MLKKIKKKHKRETFKSRKDKLLTLGKNRNNQSVMPNKTTITYKSFSLFLSFRFVCVCVCILGATSDIFELVDC